MTSRAQCDEVALRVFATLATKFLVVNLKIRSAAADLALPAIPPQYVFTESVVQAGVKSLSWLFCVYSVHEACSVTSCRNACR
jgi:hypothetical protein